MAQYVPNPSDLGRLKDKVIIITGGSNGIGAATAALFANHGAKVVSGDISPPKYDNESILYRRTDVTSYSSLVDLFDFTLSSHGRVDIAISNAAVIESPDVFAANLDLQSVRKEPNLSIIDINVKGVVFFSRLASVYLRRNAKLGDDKCLLLMSSVAGFTYTPDLYVYGATKHAVMGLMRPLAPYAASTLGFRVNCICPWTTDTEMVSPFINVWKDNKFALNSPSDIARIYAGLAVDQTSNGKAIYVEGGRCWDIEEGIKKLGPDWLGQDTWDELVRGQNFFGETNAFMEN